ncbi:MAG: hypothetical protein IH991_11405 [Planctomycetes bacterium]|nr:hypothetical protein [Planctomycetota bacterium]
MSESHESSTASKAQGAAPTDESDYQFHDDNLVVDAQVRLLKKLAESAASLAVRRLEQQASVESEK